MKVGDVASRDILIVAPGDSALKIGSLMDSKLIGAAVVVEDGEFRGIISKETFVSNLDLVCDRPFEQLLVSDLMEADIKPVNAEDDLMTVVDVLSTQKGIVDRLPVMEHGRVVGLVSKLELTEFFAKNMGRKFKVGDLMHYNPATVFDYNTLDRVVDTIKKDCVKSVLVLSGDKLVGIISVRDLSVAMFRKGKGCKGDTTSTLTAEDIMTRNPVTVKRNLDAAKAAAIMVERKIGGIPVVEGRLEGLITRSDLLKGFQLQ